MTKFGELPELFAGGEIELKELQYFHDGRAFTIGGEVFDIQHPDLYRELQMPGGESIPKNDLVRTPVSLGAWGKPITSPRFYTWLTQIDYSTVFQQTSDIMRSVFEELEDISLQASHNKEMHPMGFSAGLVREGHICLSVSGNCACMGTIPDGNMVDYHDWDSGFAELTLHNIDTSVRYISIMAGLGHLAVRCDQES